MQPVATSPRSEGVFVSRKSQITELSIRGFKSIERLDDFEMRDINVLIGPNGAGKSNFVSFFEMLREMIAGKLQIWTKKQGSADRILSFGVKHTDRLSASIRFRNNGYDFALEPTIDGGLIFVEEEIFLSPPDGDRQNAKLSLGRGAYAEAQLEEQYESDRYNVISYCYRALSSWNIYHFHDTSNTAGVKRLGSLHDNESLRPDASNLAAYLYMLRREFPSHYEKIRKMVRLAIPFFDDFVLKPKKLPTEEQQIRLLWTQRDSDYPFWPSQLSDGSLRFICLVTALLQPDPPSTIVIDEPELGLHPYAITLLGSLIRSAAEDTQVIISTQSIPLVNEFSIEDIVVVEREDDATVFRRHDEQDMEVWLEEYSVGELWEKNILGGRPER